MLAFYPMTKLILDSSKMALFTDDNFNIFGRYSWDYVMNGKRNQKSTHGIVLFPLSQMSPCFHMSAIH